MVSFSRISTSAPPSWASVAAVRAAPPDPTTTTSTTRSHSWLVMGGHGCRPVPRRQLKRLAGARCGDDGDEDVREVGDEPGVVERRAANHFNLVGPFRDQ